MVQEERGQGGEGKGRREGEGGGGSVVGIGHESQNVYCSFDGMPAHPDWDFKLCSPLKY